MNLCYHATHASQNIHSNQGIYVLSTDVNTRFLVSVGI